MHSLYLPCPPTFPVYSPTPISLSYIFFTRLTYLSTYPSLHHIAPLLKSPITILFRSLVQDLMVPQSTPLLFVRSTLFILPFQVNLSVPNNIPILNLTLQSIMSYYYPIYRCHSHLAIGLPYHDTFVDANPTLLYIILLHISI